jgi:nucleotide-binding universal stress UspA family protein
MTAMRPCVLLANDGETPDPAVARTACDLARRLGARLSVVHVAQVPGPAAGAALASKAPPYTVLATLVAQCASAGGPVARANLRLGAADREILDEAAEIGAGLIVVSGRRCDRARCRRGDALGDRLGRCAICPVLIVRDDVPGTSRVRLTIGGTGVARPRRAESLRVVAG